MSVLGQKQRTIQQQKNQKEGFISNSYFFLSKVHSILLVGGFEGACQSNHRIIDRLAGDGGGG